MTKIRATLLGVALVMGFATGAHAQGGGGGGGGGQGRGGGIQALLTGIDLTDAQKTQLKTITDKYAPQMQELRTKMQEARAGGGQVDSVTMAKSRELNGKQRDEVRAILTPEQQTKFDENVKNMPAGGRRPPGTE
jgi:Spy/CpxP family protein refolding chaperone